MALINIEPLLLKIKNRRLVVGIVLAIVLVFLGNHMLIGPALTRFKALQTDQRSLGEKAVTYSFIVDAENKIGEVKKLFPVEADKTWLIEQLNGIADKSNFLIISISPDTTKKIGDLLEATPVRIDGEAGYHQLGNFVSQIESLEPYVKISNVEIGDLPSQTPADAQKGGKKRASDAYRITVVASVFKPGVAA